MVLNTGMRKEEILSLKWKDLDYRIRTISILDTKNGESREIPMNDIVYRTLLDIGKKADSPWVFCKKNGERYGNIRKAFEEARNRAGITDFQIGNRRTRCLASSTLIIAPFSKASEDSFSTCSNLLFTFSGLSF